MSFWLRRCTEQSLSPTEETLDGGGRSDEDEAGLGDGLSEVRVLRQEAIAGVDGRRPRASSDLDDASGVEVALARCRRSDRVRGVRGAHMKRIAIDIAIDGDRANAEVVAGADDAKRDLAAIGDEDGGERRSPLLKRDVAVLATWVRVPLACERA